MRFTDEFYQIFREQFLFIQIIAENGKVKSCAQGYTESGKARFLAQATWLRISALNSCASANIA